MIIIWKLAYKGSIKPRSFGKVTCFWPFDSFLNVGDNPSGIHLCISNSIGIYKRMASEVETSVYFFAFV